MAKLTLGEYRVEGDRFPGLYIRFGRKRYAISGRDATRLGQGLAEAARWSVSRVDIDVLRDPILDIEVTPL